jgi:glyoxylase-like metal-dependent hydrolase (beta-lactamase superfamily II)
MVMLEVVAVPVLTDNYVWLIHNAESGETAAVDPSVADPVLDALAAKGWRLTQILNTHWHPDHTGGNAGIKSASQGYFSIGARDGEECDDCGSSGGGSPFKKVRVVTTVDYDIG